MHLLPVTPHVGVWIETWTLYDYEGSLYVTPHVGVWIETRAKPGICPRQRTVTPHVGVWIETLLLCFPYS